MNENIHQGRRKRLKERYLKEGLHNFAPHEILELLLMYAIPRRDTNVIAHALLKQFGSLSNVFNASFEELMLVKGVGEECARLIRLNLDIAREVLKAKSEDKIRLSNTKEIEEYCKNLFINTNYEVLYMICLNAGYQVLSTIKMADGTISGAECNVRKIVSTALSINAVGVILTHNHPGGNASPSKEDVIATNLAKRGLNAVDIKLIDHIIVTEKETFSLAKIDFLL